MEQASSLLSRAAEHVPGVGITAKDAGVHNLNGTKIVELVDPIAPTKFATTIDDQLPSLLSLIIDGLPPLQQSKYVHEAEKRLQQFVERYQNVVSLDTYCQIGVSIASYMHPRVSSLDRLVVISINYALQFLLDDLFFDTPNEFQEDQYGVGHITSGSPEDIQEYVDHLDAVFSQQVQPRNPTPLIETLVWEAGRDTLELSNPEWFKNYVAVVVEHHRAGATSHADIVQGHNSCFEDMELFTVMRCGNGGGKLVVAMIEFANNIYIPSTLKATPYFESATLASSIHNGFTNDIFSYHKESRLEQNPRNLITVLMECEGKPFVQTVHMAIDLVNSYARTIMELEAQTSDSIFKNHLQDIKALLAGNVYFCIMDKRYRHPDSVFPELRNMISS